MSEDTNPAPDPAPAPGDDITEPGVAEDAVKNAKSARAAADAMVPLSVRTMADLRRHTMNLADLMEEYANQLRVAVGRGGHEHS